MYGALYYPSTINIDVYSKTQSYPNYTLTKIHTSSETFLTQVKRILQVKHKYKQSRTSTGTENTHSVDQVIDVCVIVLEFFLEDCLLF